MYQIGRKHTKCVVDFRQANMLGHDKSGLQNLVYKISFTKSQKFLSVHVAKDESKRGEGALSV